MASKPTKLDELVEEAASIVVELEQLDGNRKLSYKSFLAEALRIAGSNEKRIAVVKKIVYERNGTEYLQSYLRKLSKMFSEPTYTQPFADPSRPARIFGSEELAGQMGQFTILAGELQCLAVMVAFERFGAECFGNVENLETHQRTAGTLREKLQTLYAEMQDVFCGLDVVFETDGHALTLGEKGRGLCRVSFIRYPALGPSISGWPQQLVASAVAKAPKTKREKLPKKAA